MGSIRKQLLFLCIISLLFQPYTCGQVESITIFPENPTIGETITITVNASPLEKIGVQLQYNTLLNIIENQFSYTIENLEVPQDTDIIQVEAENIELLRVSLIINEIPITQTAPAIAGSATIQQKKIKAGTYWAHLSGISMHGYDQVSVKVSAISEITTNSEGKYSLVYETKGFPPGELEVISGTVVKTINVDSSHKNLGNLAVKTLRIPDKLFSKNDQELIFEIVNQMVEPPILLKAWLNGELLVQEELMVPINETETYELHWRPESSGEYNMKVIIDPLDDIVETDETDNIIDLVLYVEKNRRLIWYLVAALPVLVLIYYISRRLVK